MSFEIHTTDFKMPEQGKVEVFVNERRAFEVESPVMVVKAPVDAGFHTVQVRLEPAPPALLLCLPWQIPGHASLTLNPYPDCALRFGRIAARRLFSWTPAARERACTPT